MKTARVATIIEEPRGEFYIMLGEGFHESVHWKLSRSLLKKIVLEGLPLIVREG